MSKIEWLGKRGVSWNPITGCTKTSAGCEHCYAERMHKRLHAMYEKGLPGGQNYGEPFNVVRYHPEELKRTWGKKPKRIFVCSMGDIFHEEIPSRFVFEVIDVIRSNPQHTFQVLTKRPERATDFSDHVMFPPNMWLGVTVENADNLHRLKTLRWTPCAWRFVSIEPLLGPLPKMEWLPDWVIVGGESGPGARPMHPDWVRGIRDQCVERGVPFFFKQWGEWKNYEVYVHHKERQVYLHVDGITSSYPLPYGKPAIQGAIGMTRVGKKKAGRILDGQTWNQFPEHVKK